MSGDGEDKEQEESEEEKETGHGFWECTNMVAFNRLGICIYIDN